jgi:hypothetical protein
MHGADDLAAVDSLEVDAGDAQVGVSELALDHDEGDAFVRHLDRVRVPELMRRESTPDTSSGSCVVELFACRRRLPPSSRGRSVDHAQQRADRKLPAELEPWIELLPRPTIHPNLAALAALPVLCRSGRNAELRLPVAAFFLLGCCLMW